MRAYGHPVLSPSELAEVETAAGLSNLQAVLRWGFAATPPWEVVEVVVQDEFCHDVVMSRGGPVFLCFDTT